MKVPGETKLDRVQWITAHQKRARGSRNRVAAVHGSQ